MSETRKSRVDPSETSLYVPPARGDQVTKIVIQSREKLTEYHASTRVAPTVDRQPKRRKDAGFRMTMSGFGTALTWM